MIECFKRIRDYDLFQLDRRYDSGSYERDIRHACIWLLGKSINNVNLTIDGEKYYLQTADISKIEKLLKERYVKERLDFGLSDDDFLL